MSKTESTRPVATAAVVLGIKPRAQFEFLGRIFELKPMTLPEEQKLAAIEAAAVKKNRIDKASEYKFVQGMLNARLVEGKKLTWAECEEHLDSEFNLRLTLILSGQVRPNTPEEEADGAEGK